MPNPIRPFSRLALIALGPLLVAGAALAGEDHCRVPMADWQPRDAVQALAEAQGLTVRRIKIDDGCYEVHARDAQGREVELKLDPATLAVVESEFEGDRERRHGPDH
ncbi:MAG: PepSY domain-containing protein [Thioclava marina]|jgi:Uncharacterized conserved protein|uniref:PepSY domain-containing protein n=1 Tax=Thioclava marina TaxID=1915077 RepID=UPI0019BF103A|nr:PepSY domain-containing protein [Thioclava marina]MBC7146990.1 PepSY domain-containing protein [Thioclava marina]